ncbi:MAG: hemerythrin [Candidatus Scalindua sp. AMX11]|nr:MAG: hemerythrin [Candidatus Scalindua sp.]NOG84587.1 hemerythrin family protein [Planctomycetota bacterium]RZV92362.1 MAG: bacteriohemerythrin [Candidatus Scalindua sp. SCAELEC01]TDE66113.1 MAG: hemerythrin [Candidatus Scalindua sp. AMX11]GJQ59087.1 MAG: hypothetical protein SCALA701_18880 [Candidatus Scalindua sp.]
MPLITWNESMSVNIEEIDRQHQEFVDILNILFDAMKVAKGSEVLEEVITKLVDYAHYHFQAEEKYFDEFEYLEADLHKIEHKYFLEQIDAFKKALDEGNTLRYNNDTPLSVDVWKLLKHWLLNHIMDFDKKYVPLFREKGVN